MKRHILLLSLFIFLLPIRAIDYLNWMQTLDDNLRLPSLSIPGSHDAATSSCSSGGLAGSAHTQTYTIAQQLEHGVRMFDLRPAWDGSDLIIYHGIISTKVKFSDALTTLCDFLDAHPQEFLFVIMRHENDSESDNQKQEWPTQMGQYLKEVKPYIINFSPSLKVKNLRGKLLLMSRDTYEGGPYGGYLSGGGDNSVYDRKLTGRTGTYMTMSTQDMYDVAESGQLDQKVNAIKTMLANSIKDKKNCLYLNHASGYSQKNSIFGITFSTYEGVQECARTCNKAIIDYMQDKTGPMGFIMMDFAGDDEYQGQELIDLIINNCHNTSIQYQEKQDAIIEVKADKTASPIGEKAAVYDLSGRKMFNGQCSMFNGVKNGLFVIDGQKRLFP